MKTEAKNSSAPRPKKFKWQSQDSNPDVFPESISFSIEEFLRECTHLDRVSFISLLSKASKQLRGWLENRY